MSLSKIFLFFCFSFIVGIGISSFLSFNQLTTLAFFVFILSFIFIFLYLIKGKEEIIILAFCFIFILSGFFVYQKEEIKIASSGLNNYNDLEEIVILEGVVSDEPDVREANIKLEVRIDKIFEEKIDGKVLVTLGRYSDYDYGDRLLIKGKLENPPVLEDFDYKSYLAKDGIYSVIYWPKVEKVSGEEGNLFLAKVLSLKNKLREVIHNNLSPPQSSILSSLILGDKKRMSDELKDKLSVSGLRHITAISGMHIVIISSVLMSFLIGVGLHRKHSFYLTIISLIFFILMIGMPASAVRAGIMVGFFLLAQRLGRQSSSFRAIVFTAAGILAFNPLLLRHDVGFQLSFLAVTGIILLAPSLEYWLRKFLKYNFLNLASIISMTISAQIFVFPLLLYNFGSFSLVTFLTNILVLPVLPILIGTGFLFSFIGLFFPFWGWILSWFSWLFLTYVVLVINWFANFPFSSLRISIFSRSLLAIFYCFLFYFSWQLNKRKKISFLSY
jgi:competence protein ComEC